MSRNNNLFLLRENYAYGLVNDLQSVDRFRSTMLAGTIKQIYYSNYLFFFSGDVVNKILEIIVNPNIVKSYIIELVE